MPHPELIPAQNHDLSLLADLMQEYYTLDGLNYSRHVTQAVESLIQSPEYGQVWLIRLSEDTIGYCVLTWWFSLEFQGKSAFLDEIYLRPNFRGQGLGSHVIDEVSEFCRQRGICALRLEVEHENQGAFKVYHRQGFKEHPRYLMSKWL
jgi:diamine N-acetyltransferase